MAAAVKSVVHPDEVDRTLEGDTEVRVVFDARNGSERLEQRILRVPRGSEERRRDARHELVYVVSGRGELELNGERHVLEPGIGVYIAAGEGRTLRADEPLELVSVLAPQVEPAAGGTRRVTVRSDDQPELEASSERTFRYLVNEDAGCLDATQFLGIVQPSKAPFHSHPYDEVGYVIEGDGVAYVDDEETALRAGSCFHLAPGQAHCIENSGAGPMRILGVFHPSGSPADRLDAYLGR